MLVIGYGSIGKRHVENLLKIPKTEVILFSKHKKSVKNVLTFSSLQKCISKNPDVAIIANNTNSHIGIAMKLAKLGIDLFIEKPLSNSSKDIFSLNKIVKNKKIVTQIGCNLRFHKCIKKIKAVIDKEKIGRIISVKVESGSYLPEWHPYEDYKKSYASRKSLGGGVVLTCIHEIDYMYWLFGDIKEVFSLTGKFSDLQITAEDFSSTIIKFRNNIVGELHLDYFQRPGIRSCKIIGTKGTIYWDSVSNNVKLYDIKKEEWVKLYGIDKFDRNDMYKDELQYFLKCVSEKKNSFNSIKDGIKTLQIALAIKKSSQQKKVVKIEKK